MTPVGPATEAGAPVVPSARLTDVERRSYLVQLATLARGWSATEIGERMSVAAQSWEHEAAAAREEGREMLAVAHDRIAQLEETVENLGADLANTLLRLDEARQNAQAASERHAIESGEQRQTIAALAAQLVREMRRGGA